MDGLFHCTSIENIVSILSSKAFYPSYCLEKAEYLKYMDNLLLPWSTLLICSNGKYKLISL